MFKNKPLSRAISRAFAKASAPAISVALCGALAATPGFAQLVANKSRVDTGEALSIGLTVDTTRQDSLFLAARAENGDLFFVDETGAARPYVPGAATPRRFSYTPQAGSVQVYSGTIPRGLAGTVTFYTLFGQYGGDVLSAGADTATLRHVAVDVGPLMPSGRLAGQVVDEFAMAATVCLDVNRNRACDSGEPVAQASEDGSFELVATPALAASHPVLALLSNGNVLEAPVGQYAVVSALTTMVKHEADVDPGVSTDRSRFNTSVMFNLPESILLKDYTKVSGDAATDAARVAGTLARVLARETVAADIAGTADPRQRVGRLLYVRNLLSGGAPGNPSSFPGVMIREANARTNNDAARAAALVAFPADPEKSDKIRMLAQQKYDLDVAIVDTRLEYLGQRFVALTYAPATNSLTFGISALANNKVMKINPAQVGTAAVVNAASLDDVPLATEAASYSIQPDGRVRVVGKNGGAASEILSTTSVLDLGGKTIPLGDLVAYSKSTTTIPSAYNIPVTFQPGDKLWREHHDKVAAPLSRTAFSTLQSGVGSMPAYIAAHADALNPVMTVGDYNVYFEPDAANPLEGRLVGYNPTTQTTLAVGDYYPRVEDDGKQYIVLSAKLLKTYKVIYLDAGAIKVASWRDFVMTCICWQRKFNVSAAQRIVAALKAANSPLIQATATTPTPTTHALARASMIELASLDVANACGGCAVGNCGACPTGQLLGLR